jgi:Cytochrome c7 and related cytochrome c/Class III cytochrome C family
LRDKFVRRWREICLFGLAAALIAAAADPPEQPLPFSHKAHAGTMKMQCKMCHTNPDPGETEGIPPASTCMQCHSAIKTDSPAIQKLTAYFKNNRPIPWVRVYAIPDFVNFSHRGHVKAGNTCEDCHGKVAESDQLSREVDISMGGCMNCHKTKNVSIDCTFCHDQR